VVAFIFISPLLGFLMGSLLLLAISWLFVRQTPSRVDRIFRRMQLISSSLYSLGHGGNDAQKTVGHHLDAADRGRLLRDARPGAGLGRDRVLRDDRLRNALSAAGAS
jgi:hypothetical protein